MKALRLAIALWLASFGLSYALTPAQIVLLFGGQKLWTPANLPTGTVAAWWDAAAKATLILSGSNVTQWNSRVGTIYASQGTSASQPTYSSSGFNGLPALNFNGSQTLQFNSLSSLPLGSAAGSLFNVVYLNGTAANTSVLYYGANGGYACQNRILGFSNSGTGTSWVSGDGCGDLKGAINYYQKQVIEYGGFTAGTNFTAQLSANGIYTTLLSSSTLNTTNVAGYIGSGGAVSPFTGQITEALIFNNVLTSRQRQQMEGYAAWKWKLCTPAACVLPPSHPYYKSPPYVGGP